MRVTAKISIGHQLVAKPPGQYNESACRLGYFGDTVAYIYNGEVFVYLL